MRVWVFPGGSVVKNSPANAGATGDSSSIPGSRRSPRGGNDNPLQRSCLDSFTDRGACWATVHRVTESDMTEYECRDTHVSICMASLNIREMQMWTPARFDYAHQNDCRPKDGWCQLLARLGSVVPIAGGKQYGKSFFMELNVCSPDGISETESLPRINENTCPHQSL